MPSRLAAATFACSAYSDQRETAAATSWQMAVARARAIDAWAAHCRKSSGVKPSRRRAAGAGRGPNAGRNSRVQAATPDIAEAFDGAEGLRQPPLASKPSVDERMAESVWERVREQSRQAVEGFGPQGWEAIDPRRERHRQRRHVQALLHERRIELEVRHGRATTCGRRCCGPWAAGGGGVLRPRPLDRLVRSGCRYASPNPQSSCRKSIIAVKNSS